MTTSFTLEAVRDFTDYWQWFLDVLPELLIALFVFAVFYLLSGLTGVAVRFLLPKERRSESGVILVKNIYRSGMIVLGIVAALVVLGVDFSALVTSLGLLSVALGFALKDVVGNFISGVFLLVQKPFTVGDIIEIPSSGLKGTVKDIRNRHTVIKTFDGKQVIMPNSFLLSEAIVRYTAYQKRRGTVEIRVSPGHAPDKVIEIGVAAIGGVDGVLESPRVRGKLVGVDGDSISLEFTYWYRRGGENVLELKSWVYEELTAELKKKRVKLAPAQVVLSGGK